ncbi:MULTISPECIES: lytic transglycosylase domain-containing protein [unclassified Xanthobacter]|uniref:lytic transglycosylase domain-containing protein n=1 Tax=unclassified Xanthobacter TaxID=2623496 RepID=UPI001F2D5EEB|nr:MULTISPECIES: lytic transglycosylase domain-containing protein [unclassified Xanthobacter]
MIGRTTINPLDPIAHRAAVARSGGQGRRRVFWKADPSSDAARLENVGHRRSLALDRSEHDGRLMAHRDGGTCAASLTLMTLFVACVLIAGLPSEATAEPPAARPSAATVLSDPWAAPIAEAAERFAIPERWIRAVMMENGGDPARLSPRGAIGLMQIMPDTWAALREKYDLGDDPWEPRANIFAGTALLRQMHDRYGTVDAMLAAYHAGTVRYDEHRKSGRALPAEAVAYFAKIAPMIGDVTAERPAPVHDEEPSWQGAALFVTRPAVTGNDPSAAVYPPSARPPNNPVVVDLSAFVPRSDDLFVRAPASEGKRR